MDAMDASLRRDAVVARESGAFERRAPPGGARARAREDAGGTHWKLTFPHDRRLRYRSR